MMKTRLARQTTGSTLSTSLIILSAVTLVSLPILITELPCELARWYQAAANEAELNQEYAAAVGYLNQAIAWDGNPPEFHAQRARLKLETKQWKSGLQDAMRARDLLPNRTDLVYTQSQLLMHLDRHETAIATLTGQLNRNQSVHSETRADLLNSLAYAHAVGEQELKKGLQLINESLKTSGTLIGRIDPLGYLQFHRAYTLFVQKQPNAALEGLNKAARSARAKYQEASDRRSALAKLPPADEHKRYVERVRLLKSHWAGILSLRVKLWHELEQADQAKEDQEQIDQLGHNGNVTMAQPIDFMEAVRRLQNTSNKLDTRGFLHYQLDQLTAARRDMHAATMMIDALCSTFPWQREAMKYRLVDIRRLNASQQDLLHAKAVMHYHQMLVHEALGMKQAANKDRNQVIDLGYRPNEQLF